MTYNVFGETLNLAQLQLQRSSVVTVYFIAHRMIISNHNSGKNSDYYLMSRVPSSRVSRPL